MPRPVDLVRVELRCEEALPASLELVLPGGAIPMRCVVLQDGVQQHEFQLSWPVEELSLGVRAPCLHAGGHAELTLRDGTLIRRAFSAGTLLPGTPLTLLGGDDSFPV